MNFVSYPDREALVMGLADRLGADLAEALRMNDTASLSVPGGTTPGPAFDMLSALRVDWDRVTVFPNDERWVPESSERSNARLIRQRLLTGRAAAARFLPLHAEAERPEAALPGLSEALAPHLPISVLLLGMGADGHTASLFPGAEGITAALAPEAEAVMPIRAAAAGEPRVSLSARVLADALRIHILITGAEKRAVLEAARDRPAEEAPVKLVLPNAMVHWAE